MKQYWLLKSEPEAFSIDDLARSSATNDVLGREYVIIKLGTFYDR